MAASIGTTGALLADLYERALARSSEVLNRARLLGWDEREAEAAEMAGRYAAIDRLIAAAVALLERGATDEELVIAYQAIIAASDRALAEPLLVTSPGGSA